MQETSARRVLLILMVIFLLSMIALYVAGPFATKHWALFAVLIGVIGETVFDWEWGSPAKYSKSLFAAILIVGLGWELHEAAVNDRRANEADARANEANQRAIEAKVKSDSLELQLAEMAKAEQDRYLSPADPQLANIVQAFRGQQFCIVTTQTPEAQRLSENLRNNLIWGGWKETNCGGIPEAHYGIRIAANITADGLGGPGAFPGMIDPNTINAARALNAYFSTNGIKSRVDDIALLPKQRVVIRIGAKPYAGYTFIEQSAYGPTMQYQRWLP